jgi:hypothetical protein
MRNTARSVARTQSFASYRFTQALPPGAFHSPRPSHTPRPIDSLWCKPPPCFLPSSPRKYRPLRIVATRHILIITDFSEIGIIVVITLPHS